jgi:hypothetical protein
MAAVCAPSFRKGTPMLKTMLNLGFGMLVAASLCSASQAPTTSPAALAPATAAAGAADPGAFLGEVKPDQPLFRIPINGCQAMVTCPNGGGTVRCVSWAANGCVTRQNGTPPWVACDGVVHSCPGLIE